MCVCVCVSYKLVELSVTMSASVRVRVCVSKSVCSACIQRACVEKKHWNVIFLSFSSKVVIQLHTNKSEFVK